MSAALRSHLTRAALASAFAGTAALTGCATVAEQQMYLDWIAIANPATVCGGAPDCVQHSTYRGKKMCTIVTADRNVSYSRLGQQVRDCMGSPQQPVRANEAQVIRD